MNHKEDFGKSNSLHMGLLQGTAEREIWLTLACAKKLYLFSHSVIIKKLVS